MVSSCAGAGSEIPPRSTKKKSLLILGWSDRKDFIHFLRDLFEARRGLDAFWPPCGFGDGPALIADVIQRFHDRRPIVVAFEVFHVEAGAQAVFVHLLAAVLFDVKFLNALAQDANPLLGPTEINDVANIEVPAD